MKLSALKSQPFNFKFFKNISFDCVLEIRRMFSLKLSTGKIMIIQIQALALYVTFQGKILKELVLKGSKSRNLMTNIR